MATMNLHRFLRYEALFNTALALPLVIALSATRHPFWAILTVPMSATVLTSTLALRRYKQHSYTPELSGFQGFLEFWGVITHVAILCLNWAFSFTLRSGGYGILAGYATAPLIINMFMHMYYLGMKIKSSVVTKEQECPNCHSKFVSGAPGVQQTVQRGQGYSLLRGEEYLDADAPQYTHVRTSEDEVCLEPEAETDFESKGKGVIKI